MQHSATRWVSAVNRTQAAWQAVLRDAGMDGLCTREVEMSLRVDT